MPIFPTTEGEIMALALSVKSGLANNEAVFPAPPVDTGVLGETLVSLQAAMDKVTAARAAAKEATDQKAAILEVLVGQVKKELRYAEDAVDRDDAKLALLGWAARRGRSMASIPGQPRQLKASQIANGTLTLEWLATVSGGKVVSYSVQRRLKTDTLWTPIASTYDRTITLSNQPRGVELEYSVVASNKSGEGLVSNSLMVVC